MSSDLRIIDRRVLSALAAASAERNLQCDERSVDELICVALTEQDEHHRWNAVSALHWRGSDEVFARALCLCRSVCPAERELGADILGQLDVLERAHSESRLAALLGMLETERESRVLVAILSAIGHQMSVEAIAPASQFQHHEDSSVRFSVVMALSGHEDPLANETLIELTRDGDPHVRDWATFALGTQVAADTPEIRAALAARLCDEDDDARCEALVGLARRGDDRVVERLLTALTSEEVWSLEIEAAALIGDQRLYPALIALRDRRKGHDGPLEEAIRACSGSAARAIDR